MLLLRGRLAFSKKARRAEYSHSEGDQQRWIHQRALGPEQRPEVAELRPPNPVGPVDALKQKRGEPVLRIPDVDRKHDQMSARQTQIGPRRFQPAAMRRGEREE